MAEGIMFGTEKNGFEMTNETLYFWKDGKRSSLEEVMENIPVVDYVEVVRCSYCDPESKDYNPCWLCKKGGTAHDVEHCHSTNYGDYEPMQPHCHLCGRKL